MRRVVPYAIGQYQKLRRIICARIRHALAGVLVPGMGVSQTPYRTRVWPPSAPAHTERQVKGFPPLSCTKACQQRGFSYYRVIPAMRFLVLSRRTRNA
eukprot:3936012-Rhodomonas_salina.1